MKEVIDRGMHRVMDRRAVPKRPGPHCRSKKVDRMGRTERSRGTGALEALVSFPSSTFLGGARAMRSSVSSTGWGRISVLRTLPSPLSFFFLFLSRLAAASNARPRTYKPHTKQLRRLHAVGAPVAWGALQARRCAGSRAHTWRRRVCMHTCAGGGSSPRLDLDALEHIHVGVPARRSHSAAKRRA